MNLLKISSLFSLVLLSSCVIYNIPMNEFTKQLSDGEIQKKRVELHSVNGFSLVTDSVTTNGVTSLNCYDKKGDTEIIDIFAGTEVMFIMKDGRKKVFYFDTITLNDSIVSGSNSRFFNKFKQIQKEDVVMIKIATNKKGMNYR